MKKEDASRGNERKYIFWAVVLLLLILSYWIIKAYIIALISAFILAYLVRPIYNRFNRKMGKGLSAALSIFLVVVILMLPTALVVRGVTKQTTNYLNGDYLSGILEKVLSLEILKTLNIDLALVDINNTIVSFITSHVSSIPSIIIGFFITLLGIYYILIDWDKLVLGLKKFLPFKDKKEVSKEISQITNILVYGTLRIAIAEFFISALGFYLLGVEFYLLLAALIFFFAFLPGLGPALVWAPTAIYFGVTQNYPAMVGTLVLGAILSGIVDSTLRAKILGSRAKINPFVMLIGIFGGVAVFGIFGFVIGPLLLSYTLKVLEDIIKNH